MDYDSENDKSGAEGYFAESLTDTISPDHHSFKNTENYFPVFNFKDDYLPLGNAMKMCFHLNWVKKSQNYQVDKYNELSGFPGCAMAQHSKARWPHGSPKTGLSARPWVQTATKADS